MGRQEASGWREVLDQVAAREAGGRVIAGPREGSRLMDILGVRSRVGGRSSGGGFTTIWLGACASLYFRISKVAVLFVPPAISGDDVPVTVMT
jgi:hypothetical protein